MQRAMTVQATGSLIVIAGFIAAEIATRMLAASPASPLAWYLNLELFGAFERARAAPSPLRFLFGPASLGVALACMVAVVAFRLTRWRLGVAFAANLSLCFSAALAFGAVGQQEERVTVSLFPAGFSPDSSVVIAVMLLASCAAAALSHAGYVLAIIRPDAARRG